MTLERTESFVPLTTRPACVEHQEFRVTVLPQGGKSQPLPAAMETVPPPPSALAAATPEGGKTGEPHVSLQYEGDRVTHIRIQCSCGQIMDLACVYDPVPKPA